MSLTRFKGFIGPTYSVASINTECQRSINIYPEVDEIHGQANGEIGSMRLAPGLRLLQTIGTGPIRGLFTTSTGALAVVSGNQLWGVNSSWVATLKGTLNTSTGPVGMADNGVQLCLVDGPYGYLVSFVDGTFSQITSSGWMGATNVVFQDGYFIFDRPDTGQFYISSLYDGATEDPLDFATAEGSPDNVVTVLSDRRQLWLFGTSTIEVWWNSGASAFPFARFDGAFIEYGCAAAATAAKFANTVLWLGGGQNADGIVWMAQGYQPQRVSNHSVELAIQACGDVSTATAWVYQHSGHMFYVLNLPNSDISWVYDISTGQWHERAYLGSDGQFERHRGECYAFFQNVDVVGDYANGNIYSMEDATRTDNGNPLKWVRRSPHISNEMHRMFYSRFQLDAQMGQGLDGTQQGTDPQVTLRWSDDFGNTWSPGRTRSLGKIGAYKNRTYWDRLGSSRNRVFEVSGSDPVALSLVGADLTIAPGVS